MNNILALDGAVHNFFISGRSSVGIDFFSAVTLLGKWQIVAGLFIAAVLALWFWRKREYIIFFATTVIGGQLTGMIIKRIVERPRPAGGLYPADSFSFPSGHALIAVAFYGAVLYYIWKNVADKFWRNALLFLGGIIILLIGFSRLYLGVHYLTDVIGGFIFGGAWLLLGIYLQKKKI
jgi:undecaprenyl-diphosphatase